MKFLKHILIVIFTLVYSNAFAQDNMSLKKRANDYFTIRGSVYEQDSREPISGVNIEVNGGSYTTTDGAGDFRIKVKMGDELVVRHKDFETVYHTITSKERIDVEVEQERPTKISSRLRKQSPSNFKPLLDSAIVYKAKNAKKSLQFITDALAESTSTTQNAQAYEVLADVYMQLKQYDLAITNYEISMQSVKTTDVVLKLAKALYLNKNYQESIKTYKSISLKQISNWQHVEYYEGLGDVYKATGDFKQADAMYKQGLQIAQKRLIKPKITDLNSKIADAYAASGNVGEASEFYDNSLELATQENKTRAVKEKLKVADFENQNQAYSDEIKLRKEALADIEDIEADDKEIDNESALTPQKQNYKIGNAYYLQRDYNKAIPYLEKSIEEAESKEDLVVKKDATRKLSEVYNAAGNNTKAIENYKAYTEVVEALYIKKEQELTRASRLNKEILEKQNRIESLETDRKLSQSQYELSSERNKRQQFTIYSLLGGLLLSMLVVYLMYKNSKKQKLANNLLALKSLRSQMNPHFIFNALNSVNSFIATNDERSANKYLSEFSQLMRSVLENSEEDFIPLKKEIELLELYTKLEHFRFKDKFDYTINVDENVKVSEFLIPPMLLQPYIENAVWHGLRYKEDKGQLHINISQKNNEELQITISDNGIGRERSKALKTQNQKKHNSKGLSNIKKRVSILNDMYKDKVDVFINDANTNENDVGTEVKVVLKKD